jgi:Rab guanine nucleotide exchange factor SEC2
MAAMGPQQAVSAIRDDVMDTRTPSPVQRSASQTSDEAYKPDLSAEVAMLSTKLVNAINYQTNLDDSLQQTRHELEQAQKELTRLRQHKKETDELIANGVLVRRSNMEKELFRLREELAKERAAREAAEKARKQGEAELENLTTALFEEANTMVAAARKDAETAERRNSQLRAQLNDTELLLASQTEQLKDLKGVMERMEKTSEHESIARDSSVPSTPIHSTTNAWDAVQFSPSAVDSADIVPEHPLHFNQLLLPILRSDIQAYNDFQDLLALGRRHAPHSRQASNSNIHLTSTSQPNIGASPSLPGAFSFSGSSSANNSPSSSTFSGSSSNIPSLKESKFYKRTLLEDIEPTLRLDLAPGLSFLSRRTVLSSLLGGSLVVEPFLPQSKFHGPLFACALCGEARKHEPYIRKHRFRTSEEESAQRYPLCDYCLGRIRAAGDFVNFLRMVRDGHWRADSEEEQNNAWEESVRLRERMFWARLGGGVVPAMQMLRRETTNQDSPESARAVKSVRPSLESIPEQRRGTQVSVVAGGEEEDVEPEPESDGQDAAEDTEGASLPVRPRLKTPMSSIGSAIVGASSGVLSTARPDVSPHRSEHAVEAAPALSDGANESTSDQALEPPSADPEDEAGTTPFEDAQTELQPDLQTTDSQTEQAEASEQLHREAEEAIASVSEEGGEQTTPENKAPEPVPELEVAAVPVVQETAPSAEIEEESSKPAAVEEQDQPTQPKQRDLASPPPSSHERRPSSVLARVRAMEAQAQATQQQVRPTSPEKEERLPGAFDMP